MSPGELVRFVDDRRGRRMIRAGRLVRTLTRGRQKGHLVIDCPEVGRELTVDPRLVLERKAKS